MNSPLSRERFEANKGDVFESEVKEACYRVLLLSKAQVFYVSLNSIVELP